MKSVLSMAFGLLEDPCWPLYEREKGSSPKRCMKEEKFIEQHLKVAIIDVSYATEVNWSQTINSFAYRGFSLSTCFNSF
jgi:hypothetical protein